MDALDLATLVQALKHASTTQERYALYKQYEEVLVAASWEDKKLAGYPEIILNIGGSMEFMNETKVRITDDFGNSRRSIEQTSLLSRLPMLNTLCT